MKVWFKIVLLDARTSRPFSVSSMPSPPSLAMKLISSSLSWKWILRIDRLCFFKLSSRSSFVFTSHNDHTAFALATLDGSFEGKETSTAETISTEPRSQGLHYSKAMENSLPARSGCRMQIRIMFVSQANSAVSHDLEINPPIPFKSRARLPGVYASHAPVDSANTIHESYYASSPPV